jgi:hypothetical protein
MNWFTSEIIMDVIVLVSGWGTSIYLMCRSKIDLKDYSGDGDESV